MVQFTSGFLDFAIYVINKYTVRRFMTDVANVWDQGNSG